MYDDDFEFDYRTCHADEYDDYDHDCLDYEDCEDCPYYYEDDDD